MFSCNSDLLINMTKFLSIEHMGSDPFTVAKG